MAGASLEALIDAEIRLSASIVLSKAELVPRFRLEVPGEDGYVVFVQLPDDIGQRERRFQMIAGFMAWKGASAFVFSSELREPDAILACAVSRSKTIAALCRIVRRPLTIGPKEWLSAAAIGNEIPGLLPARTATLTHAEIADLERVFGPQGAFKVSRGNSRKDLPS